MSLHRRILVSAGDPSGDLILSEIIKNLREVYPTVVFDFVGLCGPKSIEQGARAIVSTQDVAVVGIVEVLRNLDKIFKSLHVLSDELKKCDSLLCVDFPDFNLRLARMAKKIGRPVDYVVAPQVWAWRSGRIPLIKNLVRRLYPAFGFEASLFLEAGADAKFLGHPIRDLLPPRNRRESRMELGVDSSDFVVGLMPGSRRGEIRRHLSLMVEAWDLFYSQKNRLYSKHKNLKALLVLAPQWTLEDLLKVLNQHLRSQVEEWVKEGYWIVSNDSHRALMAMDFGWICSGTATLEAGYYQVPHILLYRLNSFSVYLLRMLSSYFSDPESSAGLPNIILKKKVIPELLQNDLTAERLARDSAELLLDNPKMVDIVKHLRFIPKALGEPYACRRIAMDLGALWGINSSTSS